jgi:hypothetical protein
MYRRSGSVFRARLQVSLPVIMCAVLGACASSGVASHAESGVTEDLSAEASEVPTQVVVINQSGQRVTVFIVQGSVAFRLGEVEPYGHRALPLKSMIARALLDSPTYLIGRPLGGTPYRSEAFTMNLRSGNPSWTIESYTPFSHVART